MGEPPAGFTGPWRQRQVAGDGYEEFELVDGVKHGPWRSVLRDGHVHREGHYADGQLHGELVTYGSVGQVLDRAMFVRGTGTYRIFTSDDRLGWEIPLVAGRKHGLVRRLCEGEWREQQWRDGEAC